MAIQSPIMAAIAAEAASFTPTPVMTAFRRLLDAAAGLIAAEQALAGIDALAPAHAGDLRRAELAQERVVQCLVAIFDADMRGEADMALLEHAWLIHDLIGSESAAERVQAHHDIAAHFQRRPARSDDPLSRPLVELLDCGRACLETLTKLECFAVAGGADAGPHAADRMA